MIDYTSQFRADYTVDYRLYESNQSRFKIMRVILEQINDNARQIKERLLLFFWKRHLRVLQYFCQSI